MSAAPLTPGPISSTGHQWPCPRFYILSSDSDVCTCTGEHIATQAGGTIIDLGGRTAPFDPFAITTGNAPRPD